MNWKFWQNKKARVIVPVTAAVVVVAAAGTAVAVSLARPQPITQGEAQTIALEHAGVALEDAQSLSVHQDDGAYEVDFRTASRSYEVTVQGRSGKVVDYSYQPLEEAGQVPAATGNAPAGDAAPAGGQISQEEAKRIALEHAGVAEADAGFRRVELERDNGRAYYEVEFSSGNAEYDYDIAQDTGEILHLDKDIEGGNAPSSPSQSQNSAPSSSTATAITQDGAKQIALEHAGVAEADTSYLNVRADRDDGRAVYEVGFYVGGTEYDYEIAQDTGEILQFDNDIEGWAASAQEGSPVTLDQARELVLQRVEGLAAEDVRIHEDWDDGRTVYEGEAFLNGTEYEFEIDAGTGTFLNWSAESR